MYNKIFENKFEEKYEINVFIGIKTDTNLSIY